MCCGGLFHGQAMYIHKLSKNTVVERAVVAVLSRYGDEERQSKQLCVPRVIDSTLFTATKINIDNKYN